MRAIVGPLCSCLSYNKYHKENLTENLNRIKVLSPEYECKEIGNPSQSNRIRFQKNP